MTPSEAEIHPHPSRTDLFEFSPFAYAFFRARHLPQAIFTVNPAQFRVMAESLAFDEFALQRIPFVCPNSRALLIDNRQSNKAPIGCWAQVAAGSRTAGPLDGKVGSRCELLQRRYQLLHRHLVLADHSELREDATRGMGDTQPVG